MADTLKFIFTMILFFLLFLVPMKASGGKPFSHPFKAYIDCKTNEDCPESVNEHYTIICIDYKCETIRIPPTSGLIW
ncbi:unnamed protein product [Trifolium pratense]|uniref:Uncharacterized protein n=1 Tax=Trifolium pratense TaxID=57577 RepID=A0ACB0JS01_TRIPR|nr:unnamed protein product [Trifolium pratense]